MAVTAFRIRNRHIRCIQAALLWSIAYYGAVQLAFALAIDAAAVSLLVPANAVLLSGLLRSRPQCWWLVLLCALPAHLAGYWRSGASSGVVLGGFMINGAESILGSVLVYSLLGKRPGFDSLRQVLVFLFCCGLVAPLAAALLESSLPWLQGRAAGGLRQLLPARFLVDAAAVLILVPALVTWNPRALLAIGRRPLRLGPAVFSIAYLLFAVLAVLSALRVRPLALDSEAALPAIPFYLLFLITSILFLLLAAAIGEGRKGQARFSALFRLSPDAISISSGSGGRILEVNERWLSLFGYRRSEVLGATPRQLGLFASDQLGAVVSERSREQGRIRDFEVEMRNKEGGRLALVLSGEELGGGDESCFITILRDVTEQRKAEDELRKQREQSIHLTRVALLGKLSVALAHELRQPLAAMLGNAQAARRIIGRQPADLGEVGAIVDDIVAEGLRGGQVVERLRALFAKGEQSRHPLAVNELVRETLALARSALMEEKVMLELELDADPGMVQGDRVQLQQVLLNLIVNASESMSSQPSASRRLRLSTDSDSEGQVRIAVADTGPGIAPDAIDKVFDAFFTTKAYGTGFGLAVSRTIVAAHGGRIEAANNPGGGATFRVILPAHVGVSS